jgi:hypothetical protein
MLLREVVSCNMAQDASHCHLAIAPWGPKSEVEFVVLDILVALDAPLHESQQIHEANARSSSNRSNSSTTQVLGNGLRNGRLFSDAEYFGH